MAGVLFTGNITPVLCTTSTKTLIQLLAATNVRVKLLDWSISFAGISNTAAPIQADLIRQTDAGTSVALTLNKVNESDGETLQTTALQTLTVEPTSTTAIWSELVHPQSGYVWGEKYPGKDLTIKGGNRLGIRVVSPGASVLTACAVLGEE